MAINRSLLSIVLLCLLVIQSVWASVDVHEPVDLHEKHHTEVEHSVSVHASDGGHEALDPQPAADDQSEDHCLHCCFCLEHAKDINGKQIYTADSITALPFRLLSYGSLKGRIEPILRPPITFI